MAKKSKILKQARGGHPKKRKKVSGRRGTAMQDKTFQQALAFHQAGRFSQAEALYRQILSVQPDHPEALHFLGLLAHRFGKSETAIDLIRKAINSRPDYFDAHYNLGNVFSELNRLDEAAASYHGALRLKPDFPDVHISLGNVFMDQGKLDDAVASFRRALALKPDYGNAHFNLGNALKSRGEPDRAIASYARALELKPDFVEARINMGNVQMDQGNLDDAIASFRQALALNPVYAAAIHNNLGNALKEQGRLDEAIASFRQALAVKPDYATAHCNLGNALKEKGMLVEAVASFRQALAVKPDYVGAFTGLSIILKYTEIDDTVHAMEKVYEKNEDIPESDHIDLGFTLGKIYEDIGDYDTSFRYIRDANRNKRQTYRYTIQQEQEYFARIKDTFTHDFFLSRQGAGDKDSAPIFILGMPRSGTTLVEQILASHPLVTGAGELSALKTVIDTGCQEKTGEDFPESMLKLDGDALKSMGAKYIKTIREYSHDASHITDKMPGNFLRIGAIKAILPNAKVIQCLRNPMDNCFSVFKQYFQESHPYAYDMGELGAYYNLYRNLMEHWEKVLPGYVFTIRYEELVSDQHSQTERLLDFCGLPWDDACLSFYKTERRVLTASFAQVRQPIYKDSVQLWKRYETHLEPLKEALFGERRGN